MSLSQAISHNSSHAQEAILNSRINSENPSFHSEKTILKVALGVIACLGIIVTGLILAGMTPGGLNFTAIPLVGSYLASASSATLTGITVIAISTFWVSLLGINHLISISTRKGVSLSVSQVHQDLHHANSRLAQKVEQQTLDYRNLKDQYSVLIRNLENLKTENQNLKQLHLPDNNSLDSLKCLLEQTEKNAQTLHDQLEQEKSSRLARAEEENKLRKELDENRSLLAKKEREVRLVEGRYQTLLEKEKKENTVLEKRYKKLEKELINYKVDILLDTNPEAINKIKENPETFAYKFKKLYQKLEKENKALKEQITTLERKLKEHERIEEEPEEEVSSSSSLPMDTAEKPQLNNGEEPTNKKKF